MALGLSYLIAHFLRRHAQRLLVSPPTEGVIDDSQANQRIAHVQTGVEDEVPERGRRANRVFSNELGEGVPSVPNAGQSDPHDDRQLSQPECRGLASLVRKRRSSVGPRSQPVPARSDARGEKDRANLPQIGNHRE